MQPRDCNCWTCRLFFFLVLDSRPGPEKREEMLSSLRGAPRVVEAYPYSPGSNRRKVATGIKTVSISQRRNGIKNEEIAVLDGWQIQDPRPHPPVY